MRPFTVRVTGRVLIFNNMTRQTAIRALNKVVSTFNSGNRATSKDEDGDTICHYYTSPGGPRCGVGILVPEEVAKEMEDNYARKGIHHILSLFPKGIPSLRKYSSGFLSNLQALHDTDDCWESHGLSELGKVMAEGIKRNHCENNQLQPN